MRRSCPGARADREPIAALGAVGTRAAFAPLLGWCLAGAVACSERPSAPATDSAAAVDGGPSWNERLETPSVETLLDALAQPHERARARLGPHQLQYRAHYELTPPNDLPELPAEGSRIAHGYDLDDTLTLVWTPGSAASASFSLSQHNDQGRGRDVIVTEGKLYTRLEHRPWTFHPLETDIHELWLLDAQRAAHDALAFVAPAATVTVRALPEGGLDGGPGIAVDVSAHPAPADGDTHFENVGGELVLDRASGLWLHANVTATYQLVGPSGTFRGIFSLEGDVDPLPPPGPAVAPPAEAAPIPQRTRLEAERRRILDGVAAP